RKRRRSDAEAQRFRASAAGAGETGDQGPRLRSRNVAGAAVGEAQPHMSSAAPTELSAAVIIDRIAAGVYPREAVETIARGFLPLPQAELIPVLSFLAQRNDAAISAMAHTSLAEIPSRIVHGFASDERARPEHLDLL